MKTTLENLCVRPKLRCVVRIGAGLLLAVAGQATLASDFLYTVQAGDHPWNLAQRFLKNPLSGVRLLQLNNIADDRHVMPGTQLRIPKDWLKLQTSQVRVVAVYGDITQHDKDQQRGLQVGDLLKSPSTLRTGPTGSATLEFADGTRVLLLRDSELELRQIQQSVLGKARMVRLFLLRGGLENQVTSQGNARGQFEIRSPAAVAAVRGTQFRVQAQGAELRTEVIDGVVNVSNRAGQVNTTAGQGTVVQRGQAPDAAPSKLLEAPSLAGLPERVERLPIDVPLSALPGATAYRTQLAPDAQFNALVSDETNSAPRIRARDVEDGTYVLRVRAIDASGLEGLSSQRELVVHARPASPMPIDPPPQAVLETARPLFRWAQGDAGWRYRLQIMPLAGQTPVDDQVVPGGATAQPRQDLRPASYQWRVAAIHPDKGQGPWGDWQNFRRVLPGPGVEVVHSSDETTTLRWPMQPDVARYHLQVARDSDFASTVVDAQPEVSQYDLSALAPDTYHVRVQAIGSDGYTGPWGSSQSFVVSKPATDWRPLFLLLPLIGIF